MLLNSISKKEDDQSIKIRFNSNGNKPQNPNGNGFHKSNGGFDYHATLLNKKRKLENDLKNGNMNNFNKVLNNAVMNSSRNNDNDLIPNKIEFKLSHILKGERKIADSANANLADLNYNKSNGNLFDNSLKSSNSDVNSTNNGNLIRNESVKNLAVMNGLEKRNSNLFNLKGSDSDNTSDLTKTSSLNLEEKVNSQNKQGSNSMNNLNANSKQDNSTLLTSKPSLGSVSLDPKTNANSNENDSLRHSSSKASETKNPISNSASNAQQQQIKAGSSRKNSCVSNSSDKPVKSHKNQVFHDNYVDSLLEWKKPAHVGSGLNNMGNTCFLNSVLQTLLYTPGLINYFVFTDHKKKCNPKGLCLMCEFHCLVDLSKDRKFGSLTPKNILNNLKFISKNIKIGRQEDAHEFLLYLLDGLEKACKNFVASVKSNFIVSSNLNAEDNLIQKLFGAKLASCVICLKCKNVSKKVDQYLDISIDIYNSDSIHRSLKYFCKPESLSGSNKFYCESCKTKNDSLKKFSFENFPRVLVLHLKRFDNFQRKIKKFIEYPADLDLTNFSENKSEKYKYRLYGVLVHEGSTISWGHYYCFIKNSNELWYCMNDSHVSQTTQKNVLNQTPYLLFYERVLEKKIDGPVPGINARKMSAEATNLGFNRGASNSSISLIGNISNNNPLANLNLNNKNAVNSNINSAISNKEIQNKPELMQKKESKGLGTETTKDMNIKGDEFKVPQIANSLNNSNNNENYNRNEKDSIALKKEKSQDKIKNVNSNLTESQKVINKFGEKSKELELDDAKKTHININTSKNILVVPRKISDSFNTTKKDENKKLISDLKYNQSEGENADKSKEDAVCMGMNAIKKALMSNQEKENLQEQKQKENQPTKLFEELKTNQLSNNNVNNNKNLKSQKDQSKEINTNLIKSKTSFETKLDLCDKIDEKETSDIKRNLVDFEEADYFNTRRSFDNKSPFRSRKFKRLMSIFTKFGSSSNPQLYKANSFSFVSLSQNELVGENNDNTMNSECLDLNESPSELRHAKKDSLKNKASKPSNKFDNETQDNNGLNSNKNNGKKTNSHSTTNKNDSNEYSENFKNQRENQELESDAFAKKRIFNTKINEIYHGRFIERWEDDEDDENELNKLRTQADFVRKSDGFKKQKLLRKSKYDMDYDAGKQKKVRIYEEKDSKGKNVFQQKHTTMLKKIERGADPKTLIANEGLNFEKRRKDKKFKNRDRDSKFSNDRRGDYNNKRFNNKFNKDGNGKFNKFNKFNKFQNKNGGKRFDKNGSGANRF